MATPKKKRGRRRTDLVIERHVSDLTLRGFTPVQIHRNLLRQEDKLGHIPHLRTVQRIAARYTVRDESGPWSLAEADAEEAALIVPVLGEVLQFSVYTEERVMLTRAQADWVAKVARVAPGLDGWTVYDTAVAYQRRVANNEDTIDLDVFLALAPWRGRKYFDRFKAWVTHFHPGWFWGEPLRLPVADGPWAANGSTLDIPMATVEGVALAGKSVGAQYAPDPEEGGDNEPQS